MSADVLQRLSSFTLSLQQLGRLPRLSVLVPASLPSPSPTVSVSQVPILFREPYVLSGYRPPRQDWRCYLLSVFQRHNESVNVWTHLLAAPVLLLRWWANVRALGFSLDAAALPLSLFLLSALTYLSLSVAAHLLQSHSERAHYLFFFLDYVGVAVYQYGCSLALYFYTSEAAWRESVGPMFLPGAAFFGWLSCAGCCFAKSRYRRPYPVRRKVFQLIPTSLAYLLDISPVVHRLASSCCSSSCSSSFSSSSCCSSSSSSFSSSSLHVLQICSFLLAAVFFSCPVPERFFPGRCDLVGQGHQIFHLLLALCTVFQLEALFLDYSRRREALLEEFGLDQLWWACVSFPLLFLCCLLTALITMKLVNDDLQRKPEKCS